MSETFEPKLDCIPYHRKRYEAFKYGMSVAGVKAFYEHRNSAKRRGIDFLFTLPEWWAWWQVDDRWSRRGRGKDKLVMARKGDTGPYSPENVYSATHSQNHADVPIEVWRANRAKQDFTPVIALMRERRGAKSPSAKPIITPLGRFGCAADAAEAHGVTVDTARRRAREGIKGWSQETS